MIVVGNFPDGLSQDQQFLLHLHLMSARKNIKICLMKHEPAKVSQSKPKVKQVFFNGKAFLFLNSFPLFLECMFFCFSIPLILCEGPVSGQLQLVLILKIF